jgi:hypothetical protein
MNKLVDIVMAALGVAAVVALTRPKSQGPQFAKAVGDAATGLVMGASGQHIKY